MEQKQFIDLDQFEQLRVYMDYFVTETAENHNFQIMDKRDYVDPKVHDMLLYNILGGPSKIIKKLSYYITIEYFNRDRVLLSFDEFRNSEFLAQHWYSKIYLQ